MRKLVCFVLFLGLHAVYELMYISLLDIKKLLSLSVFSFENAFPRKLHRLVVWAHCLSYLQTWVTQIYFPSVFCSFSSKFRNLAQQREKHTKKLNQQMIYKTFCNFCWCRQLKYRIRTCQRLFYVEIHKSNKSTPKKTQNQDEINRIYTFCTSWIVDCLDSVDVDFSNIASKRAWDFSTSTYTHDTDLHAKGTGNMINRPISDILYILCCWFLDSVDVCFSKIASNSVYDFSTLRCRGSRDMLWSPNKKDT